ncbi:Similar to Epoxide hydrolase 2; acc. no. P34913 [Pyronema omphalodes CBS 100304]|uniref:Similar to Epoxide hydrolase 2 acc. no. P34913 n=1 Tax=Pyronema omphalodes (strain CBS 100304) TaxID=1076935 RepID=U4L533_PYROM|nr:Similar to Epoxide hydrolase 2; acc. no. P34913 [Pyronema omphalodes CBS 100304]
MSTDPPITAIFFDIGGVCVRSPMLAIASLERRLGIPSGYINFAIQSTSPHGSWQLLERNELPLNATFFTSFTLDLMSPDSWRQFHVKHSLTPLTPLPPQIDGEALFWDMMNEGRTWNPVMMGAVRKLREAGKQRGWKVGALTNDYKYPDGHPLLEGKPELRREFDVWVGSSECGMRKPERGVYQLAMEMAGVKDGRGVVFCDDIGVNLKAAKECGWRGIKVVIGRTEEAVRELERVTGVKLLEEEGRSKL